MDGIFILSLRCSARFSKTSRKDERGPAEGDDETACDEIEGGFPFVRSHAAGEEVDPDVFTLLHFYLSI